MIKCKVIKGFAIGSLSVFMLISCNGDMLTKVAGAVSTSPQINPITTDSVPIETALANGVLTKRWREPIIFPQDTSCTVGRDSIARYIKAEQHRRRDSVRRALDKRPKHIYFTFDDGPLIGSRAIDSIVTAKDIRVSAFLVGRHRKMSRALNRAFEKYKENSLIECYNHSFSHAKNRFTTFYNNPIGAYDDFAKNEVDLGLRHKIVRMPGRNIWIYDDMRRVDLQSGAGTADLLATEGFKIFGWDVEWKIHGLTGKPIQSVDEIYTRLRNYMNNKSSMEPNNVVLLMHDDMFRSTHGQELLTNLIDTLKQNTDFSFEFMSTYPHRY
ncbi:MAG: polysaccharide deacetylase family protein [Sphingobacterium sp.]|uniref:polysaccharide deacetylase family protein n=1 Tax=Sphingobacterium sp. JB170 TaxID=1434842 RepID=UPI00097E7E9E|nr:polysaccharide deacetylase family protein [Sphingobacterium sp. JB170]SJN48669.1 hypothetical protein FM107_17570 [Sphingobacterium sp. JB170]